MTKSTTSSDELSMSRCRTGPSIGDLAVFCPLSFGYFLELLLLIDRQGIPTRLVLFWILGQPHAASTWPAGITSLVCWRDLAHCQMVPVEGFQLHGITQDYT